MRGRAVTVNVRMPKSKKGGKRRRRQPYQTLKSTGWVRGTPDSITRFGATYSGATPEQLQARRMWHYRGNGLYGGRGGFLGNLWGGVKNLWGKTEGIRALAGTAARSGALGPQAMAAGHVAGLLGIGDYEAPPEMVVNNDIVNGGAGQGIPEFAPGPNEVVISHKEYVCDIFGPETAGTFQNQTFGLNPALATTFPWLSQVAANYDEYTFVQMIFTFRSTVTDFVASNGQVGSVIMATQYNANDTPFTSKQDAMEYDGAVSGKCSEKILHGVECDPTKLSGSPGKYTRSGPAPPGEDLKTYDAGTLNVSVSNTPSQFSNQALGELWVSYTVQLRKPKFFVTRGQNILRDVWVGQGPLTGSTDINDIQLGVGQQNRIGGMLVNEYIGTGTADEPDYAKQPGFLYYVFPHTFSGTVEVKLSSKTNVAAYNQVLIGNAGPGITPVNDIWWSDTSWVNKVAIPQGTGDSTGLQNGYWHFKITAPTSAQTAGAKDNVLAIVQTEAAGTYSLMLDIGIYNTGLSYPTTPAVIIESPQTGLVETWP